MNEKAIAALEGQFEDLLKEATGGEPLDAIKYGEVREMYQVSFKGSDGEDPIKSREDIEMAERFTDALAELWYAGIRVEVTYK